MNDRNLCGVESLGEVGENTDEQRHAAALAACHHAADATEAAELLEMLGLTSDKSGRVTKPCAMCRRPMSNLNGLGHVRQHAKGMCSSCYGRSQRGGAPGRQLVVAVEDIDTLVGVLAAGAQVYAKALGDGWLLYVPGSRIPVAVGSKAVQLAEVSS